MKKSDRKPRSLFFRITAEAFNNPDHVAIVIVEPRLSLLARFEDLLRVPVPTDALALGTNQAADNHWNATKWGVMFIKICFLSP